MEARRTSSKAIDLQPRSGGAGGSSGGERAGCSGRAGAGGARGRGEEEHQDGLPAQRLAVRPWGDGLPAAAPQQPAVNAYQLQGAQPNGRAGGNLDLLALLPAYGVVAMQAAAAGSGGPIAATDAIGRREQQGVRQPAQQHTLQEGGAAARLRGNGSGSLNSPPPSPAASFPGQQQQTGNVRTGRAEASANMPPSPLPGVGLRGACSALPPRSARLLPQGGGARGVGVGASLSLDLAMLQPRQQQGGAAAASHGHAAVARLHAAAATSPASAHATRQEERWGAAGRAKRARA